MNFINYACCYFDEIIKVEYSTFDYFLTDEES